MSSTVHGSRTQQWGRKKKTRPVRGGGVPYILGEGKVTTVGVEEDIHNTGAQEPRSIGAQEPRIPGAQQHRQERWSEQGRPLESDLMFCISTRSL